MSGLTPCNHCNLRWLRQAAEAGGKVVTTLPGTKEIAGALGVEVYVHAPGEAPSEANWKAWFMALGDRCECTAPESDVSDCELPDNRESLMAEVDAIAQYLREERPTRMAFARRIRALRERVAVAELDPALKEQTTSTLRALIEQIFAGSPK